MKRTMVFGLVRAGENLVRFKFYRGRYVERE